MTFKRLLAVQNTWQRLDAPEAPPPTLRAGVTFRDMPSSEARTKQRPEKTTERAAALSLYSTPLDHLSCAYLLSGSHTFLWLTILPSPHAFSRYRTIWHVPVSRRSMSDMHERDPDGPDRIRGFDRIASPSQSHALWFQCEHACHSRG